MGLSILERLKSIPQNLRNQPWYWLKIIAYLIPLSLLGYVIYINVLPFGFEKTYRLDIGSNHDTTLSELYLEPAQTLSERQTNADGATHRELRGMAQAIFKPANTKDLTVDVSIEGQGVSLIPIELNLDRSSVPWKHDWDFTTGIPKDLINKDTFYFDKSLIFNGKASLELPSSTESFESSAFSVFADWLPTNSQKNSQEIVGHFNWEIYQNSDSVTFRVGRMDQKDGPFHVATYHIPDLNTYFGNRHTLFATYVPDPTHGQGYIELYVDNTFAERTYFGASVIWDKYNDAKNLTLGKSSHASANFFSGSIYRLSLVEQNVLQNPTESRFTLKAGEQIAIPVFAPTTSTLSSITVHATAH